MKKGTFFTSGVYCQNRLFDLSDLSLNMNNCNYAFSLIRQKFWDCGFDIATQDIYPPQDSDFVLYFDMPKKDLTPNRVRKYLLMIESVAVRPDNWGRHEHYDRIFTWDDRLVDHDRYIKIQYSLGPKDSKQCHEFKNKKLCALVSSNKSSTHPHELYSERLKAINWFESNHPEDFDFYGAGWDRKRFKGFMRPLNRVCVLGRMFAGGHPCFKGRAQAVSVLPKYKFAICYENVCGYDGYITEKILTCFLSGCVPIYLGAPNIREYIPEGLFISREQFNSYEDLYIFISTMTEDHYQSILDRTQAFLKSEAFLPFTPENFAKTITETILSDLT